MNFNKTQDLVGDARQKFSCINSFLVLNKKEEIFEDSVRLGRYMILEFGMKHGLIK